MDQHERTPPGSKLIAGELCLDFANTADWHASKNPQECLGSYGDLVRWSRHAGILDRNGATRLLQEARERPQEAMLALQRAIILREVIYRIVVAIVNGKDPDADDLDTFNRALVTTLKHLRIALAPDGLAWAWEEAGHSLDEMLWPILRSAADLLTSDRRERIGQCADDRGCGWLFLDRTKNRSRRWCQMEDCGNRAKARRHYRRKRAGHDRPRG